MSDLWKVVAELGLELHPERISALASVIASLNSESDFHKVRRHLSPNINSRLIDLLENKWKMQSTVTSSEIASALVSASITSELTQARGSIEMVWTGPSTGLVPIRHTEQVLCEVIEQAKTSLFVVSFVATDVPRIHLAINKAIERNVSVDILVESSQNSHSRIRVDSVPKMKASVPGANIYIWDQSKIAETFAVGVVHAKCAVADSKIAFITSANLTTAAMEKNIELGVFVKGGNIPTSLYQHLQSMVVTGILKKI